MQILKMNMRADGVKIPTVHKYTAQQVPGARFISSASFFNQNSTRIISPQATLEVGKTYKKLSRKSGKNAGKTATKVIRILVGVKAEKNGVDNAATGFTPSVPNVSS